MLGFSFDCVHEVSNEDPAANTVVARDDMMNWRRVVADMLTSILSV